MPLLAYTGGERNALNGVMTELRMDDMLIKNIWMIGDNPINDILGAKKCINATTLQKIHPGTPVGVDGCEPHASFENYSELRSLIKGIIDNE